MPWSLKRAPLLVEMGREMWRVLEEGEGDGGHILRKLLILPKQLPPCRSAWHAVCYTYCGETNFDARNCGGSLESLAQGGGTLTSDDGSGGRIALCIPFQCKLCWFWNIEGQYPVAGKNNVYLTCIRWANFDAMLGKSLLTIRSHRREMLVSLKNVAGIGKTPAYHPRGPFLVLNQVGMSLEVDILVKSLVTNGRILYHIQFLMLRNY
jgi:hypothetical protein